MNADKKQNTGPKLTFVSQGNHRIDSHGAPRGHVTGEKCDCGENCRDSGKYSGIEWFYSVKQGGQTAREHRGARPAAGNAERRQREAFTNNDAEDRCLRCAQRQSKAYLSCLLRH
jgi:hypothetical protein